MLSPGIPSYVAGETIPAGARVKFSPGSAIEVVLSDATDIEIGTAILYGGKDVYSEGDAVGVKLLADGGTRTAIANGVIAAGATVKRQDDGKVGTGGGGDNFGIACESATTDGDMIEVMWAPSALATPADAAVTTAKLATAVAQKIPTVAVSIADAGSHVATVTIQAKDAQGNNLAARVGVRVFFSATSFGAPTDLGAVVASTGAVLKADTTDALLTCVTDATGLLVLSYTLTGAGNIYAHAEAGGLYVVGNAAIA